MTKNSYSQLLILSLLIISYTIVEANVHRRRRQVIGNTNLNLGVPPQKPVETVPFNNIPIQPSSISPVILSNGQNNLNQANNNNHLLAASHPQVVPIARSNGFYNHPQFQPPPFTGEKPQGWFGTNHVNWISNQYTETDKNKIATDKFPPANIPSKIVHYPRRDDGGPHFLRKVAKQYADKGANSFSFGPTDSRQGHGSICTNHENFDGYTFGSFACPLPASTGMNQLDQFCCGPANYQHCCNAQEFSYTQRGGHYDTSYIGDQRFPKLGTYSTFTKKTLPIIGPIFGVVILAGIVAVVYFYYRRIRKDQNRARKPAGAVRLDDNYSIVPQDLSASRSDSPIDDL